jgi:competence protein ComEC
MNNDKEIIVLVCGFISAIFVSSFLKLGFSFFLLLLLISVIFFIYQKYLCSDFSDKKKIFIFALFLLSFSLGILRYEIKDSYILDENLENNINKKLLVEALIVDEPLIKNNQQILTVDFRNIILASSTNSIYGKALIKTDVYPEFNYGDLVKVSGKLEKPENSISSSSERSFDYVSYLGKDDIFYEINFAKAEIISSNNGNIIKSSLFKIKNSFILNINKVISEPESSLLSGIILGSKSSLDEKTSETFRIAGLSHLIALSGYNITIVSESIMKFFSFLPRNFAFSSGVFGIILFVLMSGSSSTAVRAGVMSLIVILAQVTRRKYQVGRALIFAGVLMILVNPKILVFDISFQLSFLATVAIIYVSPVLKEKLKFVTDKLGLRDIVSSTISAQLLVLPLILYKMGLLSIVSLPVNILVLLFIPTIMLLGFLTGLTGYFSYILSLPFAWITWLLLAYIVKVSEFFARLPFSHLEIKVFPKIFLIFSYLIIAIWFLYEKIKMTEDEK